MQESSEDPPEGAPIGPLETPEATDPFPGEHFPETRERFLSKDEVSSWEYTQVRYAINEIFARHGAVFKTDYVRKQFETMPWYSPVPGRSAQNMVGLLSETERKNLQVLGNRRSQLQKQGAN